MRHTATARRAALLTPVAALLALALAACADGPTAPDRAPLRPAADSTGAPTVHVDRGMPPRVP